RLPNTSSRLIFSCTSAATHEVDAHSLHDALPILARSLHREGDAHFPGWDIRMNFSWNQSGRVRDGAEVSRDHDERWNELVDNDRSEEHTSELQSRENLVCRLLHEKKKQVIAFPKF